MNTIIIGTSNLGSEDVTREYTRIGFGKLVPSVEYEEIKKRVMREVLASRGALAFLHLID